MQLTAILSIEFISLVHARLSHKTLEALAFLHFPPVINSLLLSKRLLAKSIHKAFAKCPNQCANYWRFGSWIELQWISFNHVPYNWPYYVNLTNTLCSQPFTEMNQSIRHWFNPSFYKSWTSKVFTVFIFSFVPLIHSVILNSVQNHF